MRMLFGFLLGALAAMPVMTNAQPKYQGKLETVKTTMTVNKLDKLVTGKDRDKQLIVAVGKADYVDVTGVLPNEDNVELGSEKYPVK